MPGNRNVLNGRCENLILYDAYSVNNAAKSRKFNIANDKVLTDIQPFVCLMKQEACSKGTQGQN
jgi:hypothetical protein